MIKIGEYQTLTIVREMPQGFYLEDEEGEEVLFPQGYITDDMEIDDRLNVFVYCDSQDREVATTEKPFLTVNQAGLLEVVDENDHGSFCQWGVMKHLFVPHRNQKVKMQIGEKHVVFMYLDDVSERLVGTTKIGGYLENEAGDELKTGDNVLCLVYQETELGYKVVVNQTYTAMVYKNEVRDPLKMGQMLKGYIKPIRPDGKIDISVDPVGVHQIEPHAAMILKKVEQNDGFLPFTDKSPPEAIREAFGISKKLFKKAIGSLYKQKLILLKPDGIYKT